MGSARTDRQRVDVAVDALRSALAKSDGVLEAGLASDVVRVLVQLTDSILRRYCAAGSTRSRKHRGLN